MEVSPFEVRRLVDGDRAEARDTFALMAEVFGEDSAPLGDGYVDRLLGDDSFWVLGAFAGPDIVGGLTAHSLPVGITEVFVAADNDDEHALDFYRAEGAVGSPVTIFSFSPH